MCRLVWLSSGVTITIYTDPKEEDKAYYYLIKPVKRLLNNTLFDKCVNVIVDQKFPKL